MSGENGGSSESATIARIMAMQSNPLPEYLRIQHNYKRGSHGTLDRPTIWNASPPGIEIASTELSVTSFHLLNPINRISTLKHGDFTPTS